MTYVKYFWWVSLSGFVRARIPIFACIYVRLYVSIHGGCLTNVSRVIQNSLAKIYNARNHIYSENFELKLCTCAQSMALGTCTKFQLETPKTSTISVTRKFRENILESSRNVSETWVFLPINWGPNKMADIADKILNVFAWQKNFA